MQFIIKTTTACNFQCVYCSEGDKPVANLPLTAFYKLVDEIPALLEMLQDKQVNILWHGGEPLLWGKENLENAMSYAEQKLSSHFRLSFSMQTNGYLLDEAYISLLQRHHVQVGISLDGYAELHDQNRRTKDDKPTFAVVWQNIQRVRQAGLGGAVLMVLNAEMPLNVDKLFDFIREQHLNCKINVLVPCGRAEKTKHIAEIRANYVSLMQNLYERAVKAEEEIVIEPMDKIMDAIITQRPVHECSYNGHCGEQIICLYTDGQIGFCGRRDGQQEHLYGSLDKDTLVNLYDSACARQVRARKQYLQEHDCKDCAFWQYCHGGCTANALYQTGDIWARDPNCEYRQELFAYLQTKGIELFRQRLLKEKRKYRMLLAEKKRLLKEVNQFARK